jgi:hypothetical protein
LDLLGATEDAAAALGAARQCRNQLSLDEVTLTHGRRISARLALLWDRANAVLTAFAEFRHGSRGGAAIRLQPAVSRPHKKAKSGSSSQSTHRVHNRFH